MSHPSALAGLKVVDFSHVRTGVQASQFFADFGAEVIHVEPRGGSPLRRERAWPFWGRGRKSIALDLKDPADLQVAQRLAHGADVVIETFRPGVADRLGIGYEELAAVNPRLVYCSITAFGKSGPFAQLQGYEGVVLAKMGVLWSTGYMALRPGPALPSVAICSYPASQLAIQAILAALYARERTGLGQAVETTLAQALSCHDTPNWFARVLALKYGESFKQVSRFEDGVPSGGVSYRLLIARTKDGHWLQFAQVTPRLFRAMMKMMDLEWMFTDPKWQAVPDVEDRELRVELWDIMLRKVAERTLDEWHAEFDRQRDVFAERVAKGAELLDHPQMVHNRMVSHSVDPHVGPLRQPGLLVQADRTPGRIGIAPVLDEHATELRARAAAQDAPAISATGDFDGSAAPLPLAGVTVIELSTYYASPYGATLLAEMGARVIKLEELGGDPHRNMAPFPEISGLKVLQGKESVAVDLATSEGQAIAYRIIAGADVVLQSFRQGVDQRLRMDEPTLRAINPDLVYMRAPGYGDDGPYASRPAFAPSIGSAVGWGGRNTPAIEDEGDLTLDQIKARSIQVSTAVMGGGNADCTAALSVGTAMMLGLMARERGGGGQRLMTTMLSSGAHALAEMLVIHDAGGELPQCDPECYGWHALYRLYPAADGEWVFLAAPAEAEWDRLIAALPGGEALAADPRFTSPAARQENDAALAAVLGDIFRSRAAQSWEEDLRCADIACVVCAHDPIEANFMDEGSVGRLQDYVTQGYHALLEEVPRLRPLVSFSRGSTVAGDAPLVGAQTEQVLREFGYSAEEIAGFVARGVVSLG